MDLRYIYGEKKRDPRYFPLFQRCWDVLTMAPSSKHAAEDELISLAWDAFDYLQASGRWYTESTTGRTEMHWDGQELKVKEHDGQEFRYEHIFPIE